jgi:hypothetical protein
MTDSTLQRLLKEWKHVLRLEDWRVVARFASPMEFENGGAVGEASVSASLKQATIFLLNDGDLRGESLFNQDIETTLVHELLHLHTQSWTRNAGDESGGDPRYWESERAIEAIALGLVGLKRGVGRVE